MAEISSFGNSQNTQQMIVKTIIDCVMISEYKKLTVLLEVLIRSVPQGEGFLVELERIKNGTSIEFNRFEMYYKMAMQMSPRRSVNFSDIGKVPFPVIRVLFEEEAVKPLTALTVEVLSAISVDDSLFLKKYIENQSKNTDRIKNKIVKVDLTG